VDSGKEYRFVVPFQLLCRNPNISSLHSAFQARDFSRPFEPLGTRTS
jgi:hypothetical protein